MEPFCGYGFWDQYPAEDPTLKSIAGLEASLGNSTSTSAPYSSITESVNDNSTVYSPQMTDVPPCIQNTVLVWVPCSVLLLAGPVYLYYILQRRVAACRQVPHTKLNVAKTLLSVVLVFLCVVEIIYYCMGIKEGDENVSFAMLHAPVLRCFALIVVTLIIQLERQAGLRSSGLCFVFWLLHSAAALLIVQSRIRGMANQLWWADQTATVCFSLFTFIVITQLILSALVDAWPYGCNEAKDPNVSPEESASFLSGLTWWWITPMIIKGYKKPLEKSDLWTLGKSNQSQTIVPRFDHHWDKEMTLYKTSKNSVAYSKIEVQNGVRKLSVAPDEETFMPLKKLQDEIDETVVFPGKKFEPSLLRALFRCFWRILLLSSLLKLVQDCLVFVNPQLLKALITFTGNKSMAAWQGYAMAVSMFITAFIQSLFLHHYFMYCNTLGLRVRCALVDSIYRKSLKLSNAARKGSTVGEITNLMSVDAQRFMDIIPMLNLLWSAPLQMCVALYFLWSLLGPSVLAGVAVMVLLIPINAVIARKSRELQMKGMKEKDRRIKLMSEILNGMKVLKLYAWEESFEEQVLGIRKEELSILKKTAYLTAVSSFTWSCATFLVSLSTFAVYVLSSPDNVLDAEKAFVSLSLFNILRFPLVMIPQLITSLVQASVSVKRVRDFLKRDELDPTLVNQNEKADNAICIDNATFTWDDPAEPTLENIDLKVTPGSLVAIVGSVGTGKTSFLSCMLGEMERIKGKIAVKGSIAYMAQQAWLQNATLKENILFGKAEDNCFYYDVLKGCALERDLELLPHADDTEIGEKGVNLSGGQKQRISLARAVYQDSSVYLLDDPLSAVDAHVGKHIFDNVIGPNGLLKMKTRLLVTNAIGYLPQVDHIVVMENGRISEAGSFEQLLKSGGPFAHFLKNYLLDGIEEEEEELLDEVAQGIKDEIMSQVSLLLEEDFPALKEESCDPSKKFELARQMSRHTTSDGLGSSGGASGLRQRRPPLERTTSTTSSGGKFEHEELDSVVDEPEFCTWEQRPGGLPDWMRSAKRQVVHPDSCIPPLALQAKLQLNSEEKDNLITAEHAETGQVKLAVFLTYARYIGLLVAIFYIILMIMATGAQVAANFWLSAWSKDSSKESNTTATANDTMEVDNSQRDLRLTVYGCLGLTQCLSVMLAAIVYAGGRVAAARALHYDMLHNIMRAPLYFFDTTPLGRLTNRFSKDIDMVDSAIPSTLHAWLQTTLMSFSTILVISISTPYILAVFFPLAILYYLIQRVYVQSARQLKRLDGISRSPIYSHFGETLQGVTTIRAYNKQDSFIKKSQFYVDDSNKVYYPTIIFNRWLSVRLELIGNMIVLFAALFAVIRREHLEAGVVGLSISYAMSVTSVLNMMVRFNSDLEANIVSVERIKEYSEVEREAAWHPEERKEGELLTPDKAWPQTGRVLVEDYATRYRPGLDLVLRGISCDIKPGERVGIVGRTGAGKSSLTLALFRIIEAAEGSISIDGLPIAQLGLHDLRSRLTIIPQEPVLFSGSLRMNLDPVGKHTDEQLWSAIEQAHLNSFINSQPEGLELQCSEGGENLSVGQRQLVCLARALLRRTRILVLDEATAAVDMETDDLIQATIRTQFPDSSVLTIAHRLNTIMDYTRIMVLDSGKVAEFDEPQTLLADKNSIFYSMAKDAGLAE